MKTRVDKYSDEDTGFIPSRSSKNTNLYEDIKKTEINGFDIDSNAKVLGENPGEINIDQIKEMLEKNYQSEPRKRTMKFEENDNPEEPTMEKTKEYDINAILEKAKEEKDADYEQERLKKVRDTQYDILKNLELDSSKESPLDDDIIPPSNEIDDDTTSAVVKDEDTKQELMDLINTITMNETQKMAIQSGSKDVEQLENTDEVTPVNPLDLLSDLKGDDNTVIGSPDELNNTAENEKTEIKKALDEEVDNSFYTNSMQFKKKDFASLDDNDKEGSSIFIKILIVIVFLAIVAGVILFLNDFLHLGWF